MQKRATVNYGGAICDAMSMFQRPELQDSTNQNRVASARN